VSGVIEISMGGEDEFGFPVPTVINRTIDLAANGTTTTSLDVADLLSDLPAVFTFEGRVIVGGAGRVGTIESDASAEVRWTIDAPLKLSLTSESTVESDPVELEMDDSEREDLRDYLVEGTFIMDIENHFPFGMDVHFQVGADSLGALDITNPNTHLLATVSMDPGQLDGNGFVSASTTRRDTVLIGETEIGWIADGGWTAVVTTIPSTGTAVGLHMRDYLAVTGIAQVEVLVEEDDDE